MTPPPPVNDDNVIEFSKRILWGIQWSGYNHIRDEFNSKNICNVVLPSHYKIKTKHNIRPKNVPLEVSTSYDTIDYEYVGIYILMI